MKTEYQRGFTLLELLSTFAILTILVALIAQPLLVQPSVTQGPARTQSEREERIMYECWEHFKEAKRSFVSVHDCPRGYGPPDIEPAESEDDILRSLIIHPSFLPEQRQTFPLDLNFWVPSSTNVPIKLP